MRILTTLPLIVLAACASSGPVYGPAAGDGFGYQEQAIEAGRYRVSYRARSSDLAESGALRRSAELTLQNGFPTFLVVSRDIERLQNSAPQSSIGIGGGTGGWRSGVGVGVNVPLGGGNTSRETTARFEIIMTREPKDPDNPRSYDASDTLNSIRGPISATLATPEQP